MSESPRSDEVELRVWRQFLVLAETLHFGRAAGRLHMTQPPLTLAMQQLERRLGVPLFVRSQRRVALAPAGAALVEPVRQLLAQAGRLPALARLAAEGGVGRLRLGFVSTVSFGPLPGWLRDYRAAHPGVAIELREATGDQQLEAFERDELDAGFVLHAPGMGPPPTLQRHSLGSEAMLLALPEGLPVRLTAAQILRQPLVVFPRHIAPSVYDAILAFYHRQGSTPAIAQEAIQMQTIVNLVCAGIGIAFVPPAMRQLQRPGVAYRALPASLAEAAPRCETSLVWRGDAGPAVQGFVALVQGMVRGTVRGMVRER